MNDHFWPTTARSPDPIQSSLGRPPWGCVGVAPLIASVDLGIGMGIRTRANLRILLEQTTVPVIIDGLYANASSPIDGLIE